VILQEYDEATSKPEPVTVTTDGDDASTLPGATEAICSTKLIIKTPPVTASTRLRMCLPPTAAVDIAQWREETDAAGDDSSTNPRGIGHLNEPTIVDAA